MKKYSSIVMGLVCVLVLTGCGSSLKSTVSGWISSLIEADQDNEQGFIVTSQMVEDAYDAELSGIDMSGLGLTAIPNICELLSADEHTNVRYLDLSNNMIRIVDQDLSCLVNLKELNLSYNQIEVVNDLGDLPNLNTLKLQKNNLSSTAGLPGFPLLEKLNLGFNNLTNTLGLEQYTNLEVLELYHNEIESVIGLENLQKLQQLKVEFNNIKDFGFVDDLKAQGLEVMTAKGNEIKDSLLEELRMMNNKYIDTLKENAQITSPGSAEVEVVVGEDPTQ